MNYVCLFFICDIVVDIGENFQCISVVVIYEFIFFFNSDVCFCKDKVRCQFSSYG